MTTIVDGTLGVTFPAGGVGNPAGAVVGTTDTQTLTNKTLTGAVMNGTVGATTPAAGAFTTLSATGITTVAAGSAALPAIVSTTGTADTGLWFPAADTVAASTAGTERMRIDSSGNVGIGTSSPSTFGTFVTQTSAGGNTPIIAITNNSASPQLNHYITDSGSTVRNLNQIGFNTGSTSSANYQGFMTFSTMASAGGTISERMRIDASGNLLLNQTSGNADAKFSVNAGSTDASPCIDFRKGSATTTTAQVFTRFWCSAGAVATGSITANGVSAATFTAYSDINLKENIVDLPSQLDNIMALRPVEFDFKGYEPGEGHQIGFIAQEVQEIYPDLVGEGTDGMLTLSDMNKNDARLIKCIQEQQALILALTDRIAALEAK
jgi:trimeric autotransporter adhesin